MENRKMSLKGDLEPGEMLKKPRYSLCCNMVYYPAGNDEEIIFSLPLSLSLSVINKI